MSKASKHSVGERKEASKATPRHIFPTGVSKSTQKKATASFKDSDKIDPGVSEKYVWGNCSKYSKSKYYNINIISQIMANKRMGLSDQQAFAGAGLNRTIFMEWSRKLDKDDCPVPIRSIFRLMREIDSEYA